MLTRRYHPPTVSPPLSNEWQVDFIKKQYWERGYVEVISPNIFNLDLWHTSGHACVHPTPITPINPITSHALHNRGGGVDQ